MLFYDASRAWHNNGDEILREIDNKKKITVSKVVFSYGMYNKFIITARSYTNACEEIKPLQGREGSIGGGGGWAGQQKNGINLKYRNPVFELTGYNADSLVTFSPVTMFFYEIKTIMKTLNVKEVLPSYRSIRHIRSFEQLCKYILFPFMQLFIPADQAEKIERELGSSSGAQNSIRDISSQISNNLSSVDAPNKTGIEIWGRAPGLLKSSIAIQFLGNSCNVGVHHIEKNQFKISITSLSLNEDAFNQLLIDMVVDEQSMEYFFKEIDPNEFTLNGQTVPLKDGEVTTKSIEAIEPNFFEVIRPSIEAYEEFLYHEYGKDVQFNYVVLDQKCIINQVRILEASEEQEAKLQIWYLLDSPRNGNLIVKCRTLYKMKIKKHVTEEVQQSKNVQYSDFNRLFGIKKHELDRQQLMMFGTKYLGLLELSVPNPKRRGRSEDSDYEEKFIITQKEIETLINMRKAFRFRHETNQKCILITIELLSIARQQFFGLRIIQFNQQNLSEEGCFFFIDNDRWAMNEKELEKYAPPINRRRTQLNPLIYHYKLVPVLMQRGFEILFNNLKFHENEKMENEISLEIMQYKDDKSHTLVREDVLESLLYPEMVDFDRLQNKT